MSNHLFTICIILFLSFGSACSKSPSSSPEFEVGSKPFHFDPRAVSEITLVKSDSVSGDRWLTVLQHIPNGWKILSPPQDQPILDTIADETFIFHLIDTLQSIQISAVAPRGPLDSFELNPPRFAIHWKTANRDFEFQVGSRLKEGGYYFTSDGTHVFIASGTSFKLFDMIQSFQFIRKKTWSQIEPDSVDEIEVLFRGAPLFYAQREGESWTDRKHRRVKQDIDTFLNQAILAQTETFVDHPQKVLKLKKVLNARPLYEARIMDRRGRVTNYKIASIDQALYGINSSRPEGVFVLKSNLLRSFESTKQ